MTDLCTLGCKPCEGGVPALTRDEAEKLLEQTPEWKISEDTTKITRRFEFKGFNKTMSFVNAVAWLVNKEMHHPDLEVGFNYCVVNFTTHAINGLSENDFICAAKIDKL